MIKRLAIVITHPIQYYAPLFRLLAEEPGIEVKVFYTWSQAKEKVQDKTFGREIKWDIPLLEGYNFEFVENISMNPGSNRWTGIDNPDLTPKIEAYDPDAVLVFGWNMKSHFRTMRFFKGKVPVWFRGDSTLLDETKGIKTLLRRLWLRYVYSNIDKAFYVGQESKKYFKIHGLKEEQLVFAPHAIDNERFLDSTAKQYEKKSREWRADLGYSEDDLVLLFAGKFEKVKNLELLIQAVQENNLKNDLQIKLLLLGNGPIEHKLKLQEGEAIKFLPFQNQSRMPIVYRLGDIFCLPSQSETWGLAVNEAMACSRPVVVSNKVGCAQDLVKGKAVGKIFEASNAHDLQDTLVQILQQDLKELGKNARKEIEKWNYDQICNAILRTLDSSEKRHSKEQEI